MLIEVLGGFCRLTRGTIALGLGPAELGGIGIALLPLVVARAGFARTRQVDESTAVRPSRMFSPARLPSASLRLPRFLAKALRVRVRTVFKPSMCVPPSTVRMLLAKPKMLSE